MRSRYTILFILSTLALYVTTSSASEIPEDFDTKNKTHETRTTETININIDSSNDDWNDDWNDEDTKIETNSSEGALEHRLSSNDLAFADNILEEASILNEGSLTQIKVKEIETVLPGKEVNYRFNLHTSSNYLIDGRATSDIGKILFNSKLMPSNEVKLSLKLKQKEIEDIELVAYFDLANFTMELDGGNNVLNKDHKKLLKLSSAHLQPKFEVQYKDYDIPEHALMLVQMLGYWSVSPEGFVHEKRSIVSE